MITGIGKGILIGIGISAVGFYIYKKHEHKVDSFLRCRGIPIPDSGAMDLSNMTLEELMETKEDIEDIIAERELSEDEGIITCSGDDAKAKAPAPKKSVKPAPAKA